jgi:hypothetical protein
VDNGRPDALNHAGDGVAVGVEKLVFVNGGDGRWSDGDAVDGIVGVGQKVRNSVGFH